MTIHMERPSVPEYMTYGPRVSGRNGYMAAPIEQDSDLRARSSSSGVAGLRDRGRHSRSIGKAERFERLAEGRAVESRFAPLAPAVTRNGSQRDVRQRVEFEPHAEGVRIWNGESCNDAAGRGAVEFPTQSQRSVERMQTITAAALGIIAGFILFLFLLYAG